MSLCSAASPRAHARRPLGCAAGRAPDRLPHVPASSTVQPPLPAAAAAAAALLVQGQVPLQDAQGAGRGAAGAQVQVSGSSPRSAAPQVHSLHACLLPAPPAVHPCPASAPAPSCSTSQQLMFAYHLAHKLLPHVERIMAAQQEEVGTRLGRARCAVLGRQERAAAQEGREATQEGRGAAACGCTLLHQTSRLLGRICAGMLLIPPRFGADTSQGTPQAAEAVLLTLVCMPAGPAGCGCRHRPAGRARGTDWVLAQPPRSTLGSVPPLASFPGPSAVPSTLAVSPGSGTCYFPVAVPWLATLTC